MVTHHPTSSKLERILAAVNIHPSFSPTPGAAHSLLDSFRESASKGDAVYVHHDGSDWKVLASGTTPSQRAVSWVAPDFDTRSVFVEALGQEFSQGIQAQVARELGLGPMPGQPLSSRTVQQALVMAETSRKAMRGVDFMTELMCSARANGGGFMEACEALGLSAAAVSAPQRERIDTAMQQRFAQALTEGQSPVAPELAQQWLRAELTQALA